MPQWQRATVTLGYTNKLVSLLNPRPDSSVVRAPGCKPDGPGFNPQSGHFSSFNIENFAQGITYTYARFRVKLAICVEVVIFPLQFHLFLMGTLVTQ